MNRDLQSRIGHDTADFCIRIMEQSLNRANAADAAPRARPPGQAQLHGLGAPRIARLSRENGK